jgi:hypothetical protein
MPDRCITQAGCNPAFRCRLPLPEVLMGENDQFGSIFHLGFIISGSSGSEPIKCGATSTRA